MAVLFYVLAVAEIALLIVAFSSGIVVAALVGRQTEAFNGDCVLAGQVIWFTDTDFELSPSDAPRCTYVVGIQGVASVLAFVYSLYRVISLCCGRCDFSVLRVICIPVYSVMAILTLAEAAVVSHGFQELCEGFRSLQAYTANYDCALFQLVNWHIYDGSGFYDDYSKAETSGWVSFLAWVSLVAIGVLHCLAERPDSGFPTPNNAK